MKIPLPALPLLFALVWLVAQFLLAMLGWAVVLAIVLWVLVAVGLARHYGHLREIPDQLGMLLDRLIAAPASTPASATARGGPAMPPQASPPGASVRSQPPAQTVRKADPAAVGAQGARIIENLHGLDRTKAQLNDLLTVATNARSTGQPGFGTLAPATMLIFHGPAGTGKTQAAEAFAAVLYGAGVITEPSLVPLRSGHMADQSAGSAFELGQKAAESALGGVLLIEDAEWMAGTSGGDDRFAVEVARGLMQTISAHPHELILIATGGPGLRAKLIENATLDRELLSKLDVEDVAFEDLATPALVTIFRQHAGARQVSLHASADMKLTELIDAMRRDAGDRFDNAVAVRRWFDRIYKNAQRRAASEQVPLQLMPADFKLL